mmetsp:Transcript_743/g.1738  ORF Transcript_743/g.1738 Transcript_743/m.1738 type:complete len:230 (-) Transcript_743:333-1022(-)
MGLPRPLIIEKRAPGVCHPALVHTPQLLHSCHDCGVPRLVYQWGVVLLVGYLKSRRNSSLRGRRAILAAVEEQVPDILFHHEAEISWVGGRGGKQSRLLARPSQLVDVPGDRELVWIPQQPVHESIPNHKLIEHLRIDQPAGPGGADVVLQGDLAHIRGRGGPALGGSHSAEGKSPAALIGSHPCIQRRSIIWDPVLKDLQSHFHLRAPGVRGVHPRRPPQHRWVRWDG